jgi:hypothetical protein
MEYLYGDDYPDDDDNAQDPNDGHWCPQCGELRELCQCNQPDGDTCSHCGSRNTERVDTISSEPVIWVCQCGSCGKTFELLVKP